METINTQLILQVFAGIDKLIELGVLQIDARRYEVKVRGELWTEWILGETIEHSTKNIMLYCDYKTAGPKATKATVNDTFFHDLNTGYFLGKYIRTIGLHYPDHP